MRTGIEGESDRTRQSLIVPSIRERPQTVPRTASPSADAHRRQNEARAHPWSPLRPGYVFSHSRQLQPAPGGPGDRKGSHAWRRAPPGTSTDHGGPPQRHSTRWCSTTSRRSSPKPPRAILWAAVCRAHGFVRVRCEDCGHPSTKPGKPLDSCLSYYWDRCLDLQREDRSSPRERLDDRDGLELGRIRRERALTEDHQVGLFPDRDRALRVFFEVLIGGPERNRVERL